MRTMIAAVMAALLLVACSQGPAAIDEEGTITIPEGSPAVSVVPVVPPPETPPVESPPRTLPGVALPERPPVETPLPPIVGGPPDTPQVEDPQATETIVSIVGGTAGEQSRVTRSVRAQSVSVTGSVREGGAFRIRVGFEGRHPVEGSCTLGVADSHGDRDTVTSWANGDDTSAVVRVAHDNDDDEGRTVTVAIDSCDFPDLDAAGVTYRIGERNSIAVAVTTAGPVEEDPNTYEFNLTDVVWDTELTYGSQGEEYMTADIIGTISNTLPWNGLLQYEYTDSYTGTTEWLGTHLWEGESAIDGGIGFSPSPPGTVRTLTITLKKFDLTQRIVDGSYYAPSGTYVIGSQRTASATITTPDFVRPPDPIYTVSMTPFAGGAEGSPVVEGDKVMLHVDVQHIQGIYFSLKFRDNWRTSDDIDQNAMWMNPENGGTTQSRERTTMVCCSGDGWLPEEDRPVIRTYTGNLWQYASIRASATVGLSSRE